MRIDSLPKKDGYRMPGEYEPHLGCLMIWPVRPGSWPNGAKEAQDAFEQVIRSIAESETVYLLSGKETFEPVKKRFADTESVKVLLCETDDAWARDVGPTFLVSSGESGKKAGEKDNYPIRGVDWKFNAWGGEVDGLYADWEKDDRVAEFFCDALEKDFYSARPFVLEGGSIASDGEGTLMVTEACLLSKGRNPKLTKEEIEENLKNYTGAEKILWLPHGIYGDETNEHVDNVCAFVKPGEVVLAWTEDESDPQYAFSKADYEYLLNETDARGRKIKIHKMPLPTNPICLTEEEVAGYVYEEGEDERSVGEKMAASYVNFYIANKGIILPQFDDPSDKAAVRLTEELFPDRTVYPIKGRPIIVGGGNIHCITQQIPLGGGRK